MKPSRFYALSGLAQSNGMFAMQQKLEEAESKHGTALFKKAVMLAESTTHDVFYWLDRGEDAMDSRIQAATV